MPTAPISNNFEKNIIEAGSYPARIYSIVDVGTIPGFEGKPSRKICVTWELPDEIKEWTKDGEKFSAPYVISKEYTFSMNEKANLRKDVQNIIGIILNDGEAESFDIADLVGMTCLVSIAHKEGKSGAYALVQSLGRLPKSMICPDAVNPPFQLWWSDFSQEKFMTLPTFLQDKLKESEEYKSKFGPNREQVEAGDPFDSGDGEIPVE